MKLGSKKKRQRFRFGFKLLLGTLLLFSLVLAWFGRELSDSRMEARVLNEIEAKVESNELNADFWFDYQSSVANGGKRRARQPYGPGWIRRIFGENVFSRVYGIRFSSQPMNRSPKRNRKLQPVAPIELKDIKAVESLAIQDFKELKSVELTAFPKLHNLSLFEELQTPTHLAIVECPDLKSLEGIENFQQLEQLYVINRHSRGCLQNVKVLGSLNRLTQVDIDVTVGFSNDMNWEALGGKPELKTLHIHRQHPDYPFTNSQRLRERLDWLVFKDPGGYRWRTSRPMVQFQRELETGFELLKALGTFQPSPQLEVLTFDNVDPGLVDLECCRQMPLLRVLEINGSPTLESLSGLERCPKLEWLYITGCPNLRDVSSLEHLENLRLLAITDATNALPMPRLRCLDLLRIDLSGTNGFEDFGFLGDLSKLERINASNCGLHSLRGLEVLRSVTGVRIAGSQIKTIGCGNVRAPLKVLDFSECDRLVDLEGLDRFENLEHVNVSHCQSLESLNGIKPCATQIFLDVVNCKSLKNFDGIQGWKSLQHVDASGCDSLENLEGLLGAGQLSSLCWFGCPKLNDAELAKIRRKFEFFHDTNQYQPVKANRR